MALSPSKRRPTSHTRRKGPTMELATVIQLCTHVQLRSANRFVNNIATCMLMAMELQRTSDWLLFIFGCCFHWIASLWFEKSYIRIKNSIFHVIIYGGDAIDHHVNNDLTQVVTTRWRQIHLQQSNCFRMLMKTYSDVVFMTKNVAINGILYIWMINTSLATKKLTTSLKFLKLCGSLAAF